MVKVKFVKNPLKGQRCIGAYDPQNNVILIKRGIGVFETIATFIHEFWHYLASKSKYDNEFNLLVDLISALTDSRYKNRRKKIFHWYLAYYIKQVYNL